MRELDLGFECGPAVVARRLGNGFILTHRFENTVSRAELCLGKPRGVRRWLSLFRYEPFWLKPQVGSKVANIPRGSEWLLIEHEDNSLSLIVPLSKAPFHSTVYGEGEQISAVVDSGDSDVGAQSAELVYWAQAADAFELVRNAARDVAACLGRTTLRRDSYPPESFLTWGWCTWDAFGKQVSEEKLFAGLTSFQRAGCVPLWLVLDDGWQDTVPGPFGTESLQGFDSNQKFPQGLAHTVATVKQSFGLNRFFVWHAIHGAWGGIEERAGLPYEPSTLAREYSPEVLLHFPDANRGWVGEGAVVPSLAKSRALLFDYHVHLAAQGVDGVKVDNQASLDALSRGQGGRIACAEFTKRALEASATQHFAGRLISSMACTNSLLYECGAGSAVRTSIDFWPKIDDSHGFHAYVNAFVSLWFGEFFWPDWDVFISGHPFGAFHAALRAVSGSAIYLADAPGEHDLDLLRSLLAWDGRTLRARQPAVPTRDCLFDDVLTASRLLKLWNENAASSVIGVFHCQHSSRSGPICDAWSVSDVPSAHAEEYVVHFHRQGRLLCTRRTQRHEITLAAQDWELLTIVALEDGFAAVGLREKLNKGASVGEVYSGMQSVSQSRRLVVSDGGELLCYCEQGPQAVRVNGERHERWHHADSCLSVLLEVGRAHLVDLSW